MFISSATSSGWDYYDYLEKEQLVLLHQEQEFVISSLLRMIMIIMMKRIRVVSMFSNDDSRDFLHHSHLVSFDDNDDDDFSISHNPHPDPCGFENSFYSFFKRCINWFCLMMFADELFSSLSLPAS